jgi:hypothetical protein
MNAAFPTTLLLNGARFLLRCVEPRRFFALGNVLIDGHLS